MFSTLDLRKGTLYTSLYFPAKQRCPVLIRCPECKFERRIDEKNIPANAVLATCPRCKCRFRFRNADGTPAVTEEDTAPETLAAETVVEQTPSPTTPPETGGDDPLPPGAVIPHLPDMEENPSSQQTETRPSSVPQFTKPASSQKASPADEHQGERDGNLLQVLRKARHKLSGQNSFENEVGVPWEQPQRYNPLMGLYQTILQVMFNTPRFFAGLPATFEGLARPLAFYVIVGLFHTLVDRMWYLSSLEAAAPTITDPKVQELIGNVTQSLNLPMTLILTPGILAIQLFFFSSIFYLMLRLVQPDHAQFRTIFRVIAYSAAPTIVCIIPVVGSLVGSVWFALCCFVGCKYAMRMPWSRTALALGPLYLVAIAIGMQLFRQVIALT